jgi:hypothetical protein
VRGDERVRGALADRVDRAGAQGGAEQIAGEFGVSLREMRCRAVNVTTAACSLGPNGEQPISCGNRALVRPRQCLHRNW